MRATDGVAFATTEASEDDGSRRERSGGRDGLAFDDEAFDDLVVEEPEDAEDTDGQARADAASDEGDEPRRPTSSRRDS